MNRTQDFNLGNQHRITTQTYASHVKTMMCQTLDEVRLKYVLGDLLCHLLITGTSARKKLRLKSKALFG